MMRAIAIAIALSIAPSAWAVDVDDDIDPRTKALLTVCMESGTPPSICGMKHGGSEAFALFIARRALADCSFDNLTRLTNAEPKDIGRLAQLNAECPIVRAYIKQRWGY
jgi:hypothetical protein